MTVTVANDHGNTDPLTFVSIGQNPDKPQGWNDVTLSDGSTAKFAGIVERNENGIVVQRIALNTPDGQDTFDGPVLTPEAAIAIKAVGGEIPPIHATVKITNDPAPAPAPAVAPTKPGEPLPENHVAVHESFFTRLEAEAGELWAKVRGWL